MIKDQDTPFITDEELAAIEVRANQATKGPWKFYIEGREEMSGSSFVMTDGDDIYLTGGTTQDQDFIAFARIDVPRLVQEVRRLRALLPV